MKSNLELLFGLRLQLIENTYGAAAHAISNLDLVTKSSFF